VPIGERVNDRIRNGKSSELRIASDLLRHGLDVYLPIVDDRGIDMIIRHPGVHGVQHYDVQVKSVSGYNRIVGLKNIEAKDNNYILVIHYRHTTKQDEFLYLLRKQVLKYHKSEYTWGDLIFNKQERDIYMTQSLASLAEKIREDKLVPDELSDSN
jgi:hypothetical protein